MPAFPAYSRGAGAVPYMDGIPHFLATSAGASTGYISSTQHATKGKYFLNAAGTIAVDEASAGLGSAKLAIQPSGAILRGNSTDGTFLDGTYTPQETASKTFRSAYDEFANPGGNPRKNVAHAFGYNVSVGGVAEDVTDHAFGTWLENCYGPAGTEQVEWYLQGRATNGTIVRPISSIFTRATGVSTLFFNGNTEIVGKLSVGISGQSGELLHCTSDTDADLLLSTATDGLGENSRVFFDLRRGTHASSTIVSSGDLAGGMTWRAYDGSAMRDLGAIEAYVDGTPGSSDMPGRLEFSTTPDGSASRVLRLTINSAGLSTFTGGVTCAALTATSGTFTGQQLVTLTTQQALWRYDVNNHLGLTVASDGGSTFAITGAANGGFTFTPDGTGGMTLTSGKLSLGAGNLELTSGNVILYDGDFEIGGVLSINETTATTSSVDIVCTINHLSSGTVANGFGAGSATYLETDGNPQRIASATQTLWATAADATRKARVIHYVYDTSGRECLRLEASGTAAMLGFFGAAAVAQPAGIADADGTLADITTKFNSLVSKLETLGMIATV